MVKGFRVQGGRDPSACVFESCNCLILLELPGHLPHLLEALHLLGHMSHSLNSIKGGYIEDYRLYI